MDRGTKNPLVLSETALLRRLLSEVFTTPCFMSAHRVRTLYCICVCVGQFLVVFVLPEDCLPILFRKKYFAVVFRRKITMVRHYKRKKEKAYTKENLLKAVEAVKLKEMNCYKASEIFGIPRATIQARITGTRGAKMPAPGKPTVIPRDQETRLASLLHEMEKSGYPLTKTEVKAWISEYIKRNGIVTPFKNDVPGNDWCTGFFKRNSLSMKKPQSVEVARKDEIYESKWYAFKVLGFLNDHFTPRKGLEAGDANEQVEELEDNNDNNPSSQTPSLEPLNEKLKPDPKLQMRKEAFGILNNTANKPQQDMELKSFFDFIQEKMKNYSRDTKNTIQQEIFQIVMRADQGYYNSMQNYGSNSSIATKKETPYEDIAGPSSSSQDPPHSPHSNSSQYS